ncbi:MFS transporter [Kibdelosporangium philippinense]|uniref:MFS transporter n=1 Tax=Kibdelosporangium philippinense TaxID=211113 RepID=A0ABS8Z8P8_9PSEU|nr:MFS transporter [Kibdelosporangium philippinense]MCE7004264.1 MFS transporter [Kibdelosporangium philippinense]
MRNEFRRAQLAIAALFFSLGFQYASWAARIPVIKASLDLTPAEVGVLLLATGVGAAAAFPLVSLLMKNLGSRRLATLSCLGLVLVLGGIASAPNYPVALVVMLADGVIVACLNVAMNAQGAALEVKFERNTMAKLHAVFSGGTFIAALLASGVTAATDSLTVHFGISAVILLALTAFAWPGLLLEDLPAQEKKRSKLTLPSKVTAWLGLAMVFGTIVEGAMTDWSALYLKEIAGAPEELLPMGIAVVSAMMVLARLFADGWRARWGDRQIVITGATLAAAGLAVALLLGGLVPALIGFACVGLGMAAVTPCIYVAAAKEGPNALTLVATMGTTGLLAGPPVIGFITNATTLVWGMAAVALSALLVTACVSQVRWHARSSENVPA